MVLSVYDVEKRAGRKASRDRESERREAGLKKERKEERDPN